MFSKTESTNDMKRIVFVNQWVNYQMKDIINEFVGRVEQISLIYGAISENGEPLDASIRLQKIAKYRRHSVPSRLTSWIVSSIQILFYLLTKYRDHYVFLTSNPPTLPFILPFIKNKYSVKVLDIYPESLSHAGFVSQNSLIFKIWARRNRKFFSDAEKVFTLTDGMANTIQRYLTKGEVEVIPYWSEGNDNERAQIENNIFVEKNGLDGKFVVMYSGNIGIGHHISTLIEVAKVLRENDDIIFVIIGEGWNKPLVVELISKYELSNCLLLTYQKPEFFHQAMLSADVGVVSVSKDLAPLCVPSKTYHLIGYELPILFITEGGSELDALAEKYKIGECFFPEQNHEIAEYILSLKNDKARYDYYKSNLRSCSHIFTKENAEKYVNNILGTEL